jgi:putative heme iron utilization protein
VTFTPDVVAAVCRHMNDDHPADSLLICRTLGGKPDATAARMTALDAEGADFEVTLDGRPERVRLPWSTTLTDRPQIRQEVVRMYEEACALAGVPPRPH